MSFFCPYTTCPILQHERLQRLFAILRTDDIEKPKTNADRIRFMNDEELAAWLAKQPYRRPIFDGWLPLCNKVMGPRICHEDGCEKCWLDWLKSPVDEEVEEYISRKTVRDAIASLSIERFELTPAYRLYVEALDNVDKKVVKIPAADVESVVRCADCKWFQINRRQDGYLPKGVSECECRHWCGPCDPTDFCSYGARMDGDKSV